MNQAIDQPANRPGRPVRLLIGLFCLALLAGLLVMGGLWLKGLKVIGGLLLWLLDFLRDRLSAAR